MWFLIVSIPDLCTLTYLVVYLLLPLWESIIVLCFVVREFMSNLNSKLDLNLSFAKDFRNLSSMVTWCINLGRLLALIIFQRSLLKRFSIITRNVTVT